MGWRRGQVYSQDLRDRVVAALGEQDAVIVGTDIGGLLAWSVATFDPHVVRRIAVLAAPHPLRLRRAIATDPRGQGRAVVASVFRS